MHQSHLEGLLKHRLLGLTSWISDSVGLRVGLENCISNKFLGVSNSMSLNSILWDHSHNKCLLNDIGWTNIYLSWMLFLETSPITVGVLWRSLKGTDLFVVGQYMKKSVILMYFKIWEPVMYTVSLESLVLMRDLYQNHPGGLFQYRYAWPGSNPKEWNDLLGPVGLWYVNIRRLLRWY